MTDIHHVMISEAQISHTEGHRTDALETGTVVVEVPAEVLVEAAEAEVAVVTDHHPLVVRRQKNLPRKVLEVVADVLAERAEMAEITSKIEIVETASKIVTVSGAKDIAKNEAKIEIGLKSVAKSKAKNGAGHIVTRSVVTKRNTKKGDPGEMTKNRNTVQKFPQRRNHHREE